MRYRVGLFVSLAVFAALGLAALWQTIPAGAARLYQEPQQPDGTGANPLFLPVVNQAGQATPDPTDIPPAGSLRVNVPYFESSVPITETAIFWFGRITPAENYADVRVAYLEDGLYFYVAVIDRQMWYDTTPARSDLESWDAVTVYLDRDPDPGSSPDNTSFRFVSQLSFYETDRSLYQAAYSGNGSGWSPANLAFDTFRGYDGSNPNSGTDSRGWATTFGIPYSSLGVSGPPAAGTVWRLGMELHDRDTSAGGSPIAKKVWPPDFVSNRPTTWGEYGFGLPSYSPPSAAQPQQVMIRQESGGQTVPDAGVGGNLRANGESNSCYDGNDFWNRWGNENFAGANSFIVENQTKLADWPCYAKYYVTFPLDSLPAGKAILNATLTLHEWGNSGGGSWGLPPQSLIQVFSAAWDWDESTITWNNAPLALENIARTWVQPYAPGEQIVWPGKPFTWDVSRAVAQAYAAGEPVRLIVYSADDVFHTGKYFSASETSADDASPDWNLKARPRLDITWGTP